MNLLPFFKSVLDQDRAPVVLCDLEHTIIYMNRSAVEAYSDDGGEKLLGQCLLDCHPKPAVEKIKRVLAWFAESREHNIVFTFRNERENKDVYMVALRDDDGGLIGYYEKHEYRNREAGGRYSFNRT